MFSKKAIHLSLALMAVTLCFSVPTGAAVLIVEPGGQYGEIQDAVNAASSGDTILVRTGIYTAVLIDDKALHVLADATDQVVVKEGITVQNLSKGSTTVLAGLDVPPAQNAYVAFQHEGLLLKDNLGTVRIEDCTLNGSMGHFDLFTPYYGWAGVLVEGCSDLAFTRCHLKGGNGINGNSGGNGIYAVGSTLALHDCTTKGGDGGNGGAGWHDGGHGGAGYRSPNSFLFASGCGFEGGEGGDGQDADEWIPAGDGGNGGHGIHLKGVSPRVHLLDCICKGGDGGQGGDASLWYSAGQDGNPGENIRIDGNGTLDVLPGHAHAFEMPTPVRENAAADLTFTGQPGDLAALFLAPSPDTFFVPAMKGQWLLTVAPMPLFILAGTVPGSGSLTWSTIIPDMGPGFDVAAVYIQSIFADTTGDVTLGSHRALIILDDSY